MSRFDSSTVAATAFAGGLLVIALTGCSEVDDLLSQRHRETFPTYAEAERSWVGVDIPGWIPRDSVDLNNLATNDETVSVIRVTTLSEPVGCEPGERTGIPALAAEWSTEKWPAQVLTCGDYEVMPLDDGWLGWFNATEPGQKPSAH